ncbi:hypothetical protein PGTUg99_004048 [Puccinia graminis f. sp. tritici]|uniref:Uncharacterized protein n=1 Tax=Puccinia graminis f. sp. tritici TaxID=56615 RepID=A0A5B0S220_PUCGR|nr:hypothetical protein PGTUg99_001956 [Puccinia graminis f. sp. tritici]KAA1132201.1 hypothetical protein PGTUg99_004048 [Puccinia graminis f. sp. tritici]
MCESDGPVLAPAVWPRSSGWIPVPEILSIAQRGLTAIFKIQNIRSSTNLGISIESQLAKLSSPSWYFCEE